MQAHELKPGDRVEIVMTVTVAKAEHYDDAGSGQGIGFTSIEFDEFELATPLPSGRTTSYFTLELPDTVEHTINPV